MPCAFPYDCVRPFLERHPLLMSTAAAPRSIYKAMLQIVQEAHADGPSLPKARPPAPFACKNCKRPDSYMQVSARDGDRVCSHCGASSPCVDPRNCAAPPAVEESRSRARACSAPGNAAWTEHALSTPEEREEGRLARELDHWNHPRLGGPNLGADALTRCLHRAKVVSGASVTDKCVAALLVGPVLEHFDLDDVREKVRKLKPLPQLKYQPPARSGRKCDRCGVCLHTPWEERRHKCGWGKKRRRCDA